MKRERLDCKDVTQEYLVFRYSCEFSRNVGLTKTYFPFLPRNLCYVLLNWICKSLRPERSIHIIICDSIKGLQFTFQRVKIGNTFSLKNANELRFLHQTFYAKILRIKFATKYFKCNQTFDLGSNNEVSFLNALLSLIQ